MLLSMYSNSAGGPLQKEIGDALVKRGIPVRIVFGGCVALKLRDQTLLSSI